MATYLVLFLLGAFVEGLGSRIPRVAAHQPGWRVLAAFLQAPIRHPVWGLFVPIALLIALVRALALQIGMAEAEAEVCGAMEDTIDELDAWVRKSTNETFHILLD